MGACVVTFTEMMNDGNKSRTRGTLTLSSSYASGGDTWTARNFGLGAIDNLNVFPTSGFFFEPDLTNLKLKAYSMRPKAASLGQNLTFWNTAAAGTLNAIVTNSGSIATGMFPLVQLAVTTATADLFGALSSSQTGIFMIANVTTGAFGFPLWVASSVSVGTVPPPPGALNITTSNAYTASSVGTQFVALSDGGTIPIGFTTFSNNFQVFATATNSALWTLYRTTASVQISVPAGTLYNLSMPNIQATGTGSALYEIPTATNMSSFTARWEAYGPGS